LHNVRKDGSEITSSDVIDGLLDDWEGVGDVGDALWGDTVGLQNFLRGGAISDGLLDEGDQFGKVGHHLGEIT